MSSDIVKLLGITLDKNIDLKRHIQNICYKVNNKIKALLRIRKFLKKNIEKSQNIMKLIVDIKFLNIL